MTFEPFSVPFNDTMLHGDTTGPNPKRVLCLHGAGTSHRRRYDALRTLLAERDIGSTAFDFIGHGETGGELKESSLAERLAQTLSVIQNQGKTEPLTVIAGSMSGATAIELTETESVGKLVLIVPGLYAADAHKLRFNAGFTERIREPESWRESSAFKTLESFAGKTLIVEAGQDTVIPAGLIDQLVAANQTQVERLTVPNAPHAIVQYLTDHPDEAATVYERIATFIAQK